MMENVENREVVPKYENSFGSRPDQILFPGDLNHHAKNKAQEFHVSVEKWADPMMVDDIKDQDQLRTGWDLLIDIDCDHSFSLAKDTALLIIEELKQYGINNIGVKFSGNRGFHIGIHQKAFPQKINDKPLKKLYPEAPSKIIALIRKNLETKMSEVVKQHGFTDFDSPYEISDIENGWSSRHLFRMPYSLHSGSWLVSLPIKPGEIKDFQKKDAKLDNIDRNTKFFQKPEGNEAEKLVETAFKEIDEVNTRTVKKETDFEPPEDAVDPQHFPPTIKKILEGMKDGRKRAVLILANFLESVGYEMDQVEAKIWEWNERNTPELEEGYVKSQLNWHRRRDDPVPPPNYSTQGYYKDMGVYQGEEATNPVSYALKKRDERELGSDEYTCESCGRILRTEEGYENHFEKCIGLE